MANEGFDQETIQEISRMARAATAVQSAREGTVPFVIVPDGNHVESLEKLIFNEHSPHPERIKASVFVHDAESFIEYYKGYADERSRVFANETKIEVTGVLDYHGPDDAQWCQHKVTLILRQSEPWKVWAGKNNAKFSQMEFAEFLEQNAVDIVMPDPAHMLEVAHDLQATTEVEFGAGSRTQDGQVRFKYTETIKASVGAGQLAVPEQFVLGIPAFVGGTMVQLQALLRFRLKESKLVIWYTLVRPEEVVRAAFIAARNQIADGLQTVIVNGIPG